MPSPTKEINNCEICNRYALMYKHSGALLCSDCIRIATKLIKYYKELGIELKGKAVLIQIKEELTRIEEEKNKKESVISILTPKY